MVRTEKQSAMKKTITLFATAAFCSINTFSQTTFQKVAGTTSNDRNYHITATPSGSLYGTGYTESVAGNQKDAFIIKYNRFGEPQWFKTYGDTGDETTWDIISTQNGDIVGVGSSSSLGLPHAGGIISRADTNGNIIWSTAAIDMQGTVNYYRVIETSSGHFLAAGLVVQSNQEDILYSKFSANGNLIWSRTAGTANFDDELMGVTETSDGHYLFAGLTADTNGNGDQEFTALKTDTAGNVIWQKRYGGPNNDRLNTVIEFNGSYYFAGWARGVGIGGNDAVVMNTDTAGNVNWTRAFGTPEAERAFNMIYDSAAGAFLIAGYTDFSDPGPNNRNAFLLSMSPQGQMNWARSYGSDQTDGHWPTGLAKNDDEGYYLLSSTNSFGPGSYSPLLIKTDIDGNTDCLQKDPQFLQANIAGWTGSNFGSSNTIALQGNALTVSGVNGTLADSVLCCRLFTDATPSNALLCPGDTLLMSTPSVPGYKYNWYQNGNGFGTGNTATTAFGTGGTFYVEAYNLSSGCPFAADTVNVGNDTIGKTYNSNYTFCPGDTVLISTGVNAQSFEWYSFISQSVFHNGAQYNAVQEDSVEVRITTQNNCIFRDTLTISEVEAPPLLGNDTGICEGDTLILTAPANFQHTWLHDPSITGKTIEVTDEGTFSLVVFKENCSFFDTVDIELLPAPETPIISANDDILTSSVQGVTYRWFFNGNVITGSQSQSHTAANSGVYNVEVFNNSGCGAISPDYSWFATSVSELKNAGEIKVYPVPARNTLTIDLPGTSGIEHISLIDQTGKIIFSLSARNGDIQEQITRDVSTLSPGIYFLKIGSERENITKKISTIK